MSPYAKALRIHRQQVVPDKRDATLRQLYDATLDEEIPDDMKRLLDRLN